MVDDKIKMSYLKVTHFCYRYNKKLSTLSAKVFLNK